MAALVEMALGEKAQYLGCRIRQAARRAFDRRSTRAQRAGPDFCRWRHRRSPSRLPHAASARRISTSGAGIIGRADRFVRTAAEYAPLVRHLLSRTWIVEDFATALELSESPAGRGLQFITVGGELLDADGSRSIGPLQSAAGLISRRSELRALEHANRRVQAKHRPTRIACGDAGATGGPARSRIGRRDARSISTCRSNWPKAGCGWKRQPGGNRGWTPATRHSPPPRATPNAVCRIWPRRWPHREREPSSSQPASPKPSSSIHENSRAHRRIGRKPRASQSRNDGSESRIGPRRAATRPSAKPTAADSRTTARNASKPWPTAESNWLDRSIASARPRPESCRPRPSWRIVFAKGSLRRRNGRPRQSPRIASSRTDRGARRSPAPPESHPQAGRKTSQTRACRRPDSNTSARTLVDRLREDYGIDLAELPGRAARTGRGLAHFAMRR